MSSFSTYKTFRNLVVSELSHLIILSSDYFDTNNYYNIMLSESDVLQLKRSHRPIDIFCRDIAVSLSMSMSDTVNSFNLTSTPYYLLN